MRMSRRFSMGGGPKKYKIVQFTGMAEGRKSGVGAYHNGAATFIGGLNQSGTEVASGVRVLSDGTRTSTANMAYARTELSGSVDGDGSLILGGGLSNNQRVEKYDSSGTRSTLTDMLGGGQKSAAATNGVGAVLICGGLKSTIKNNKCNKYLGGVLSAMPNMSTIRYDHSAVTDGNGTVRVLGGEHDVGVTGIHDYYTTADVRTTTSGLYTARRRMAAAMDGNGSVLFCGGYLDTGAPTNVAEIFTAANVHSSLPNMTYERGAATAIMSPNGDVVIAGGTDGPMDIYSTSGVKTTFSGLVYYRTDLMSAYDEQGNMIFAGGAYGGTQAGAYLDKLSYN
ncbi:MAG: Kelch repeat-containing protein [Eubacteriales bacterium]